jgi:CelD/BcsL family acetyltransferase involved in cellulose biosynthesis
MKETMAGFTTTIMRDVDELRRVEAEWRSLALSLTGITIFQLPEWVLTWWSYFGAGKHLFCVAVHHSGELVGFAPLMIQRRFGLRTVSFLAAPLNDHNCFVVADADASLIRQAILQCLLEHAAEWDMIDLKYVDAHSLPEWREALGSNPHRGRPRGSCLALRPTPCPRMPVPLNAQSPWDMMSAKRRKDLKRRERQLARDHDAAYGLALTPTEVASELPSFLDLKRRSWQARGKLAKMNQLHLTPAFAGFLRDACVQLAQRRLVVVAHVKVHGIPIASRIAFMAGSTFSGYQRTYDTRFSRYAPGMLLDIYTARYALKSGVRTLDYGTGKEPYKFALGASPYFGQNLVVASRGLRGRILLSHRWLANKTAILRDSYVAPLLRRFGWRTRAGQDYTATEKTQVAEHARV